MGDYYLVGPRKSMFFKKRDNWDLDKALEQAQDGDTIELEEDFNPDNATITINKSITIIGNLKDSVVKNARIRSNALKKIIVTDGATVTLKDLNIITSTNESNNLFVKDKSTVVCENVKFTNLATQGDNYPIIYVEDDSKVSLEHCMVDDSEIKDGQHRIYVESSQLELKDTSIRAMVQLKQSRLMSDRSTFSYFERHALLIQENSEVELRNSSINGGSIDTDGDNYPIIKITDTSKAALYHCEVKENVVAKGNHIVYVKNSELELIDSNIYANIQLEASQLNCKGGKLEFYKSNALFANDKSKVNIEHTDILGGFLNEKGSNFPVIYIKNESKASLKACEVKENEGSKDKHKILVEKSELELIDTKVYAQVNIEESSLNIVRSSIEFYKRGALFVNNRSHVNLENTVVQGGYRNEDVENYPVIYIKNESKASMKACEVQENSAADEFHNVYVENSELELINSKLSAYVDIYESQLKSENSYIEFHQRTGLYVRDNSKANLYDTVIDGGKVTNDNSYSAVLVRDSEALMYQCTVKQPHYSMALNLLRSNADIQSGTYDSITVDASKLKIKNITINESLQCLNKSKIEGDTIYICGKDNGKINVYADQESSIHLESLNFGRITSPNMKMNRNVAFKVPVIQQLEYDQEAQQFITSDNQYQIVGPISDIEYFGELSSYDQLHEMIGIKGVKTEVDEFIAVANMNKLRKEKGLDASITTLHSLYLGNPGTGKTTVARIVGNLLYEKGIIASNKFKEVSRSQLVAQYVGQTAKKTRDVLESALGGTLFIDEAYTLSKETSGNDYGREAIDEILKFMEDHRDNIVIIFAGYTKDMEQFLNTNEGLKSRIPNVFNFENYSVDELVEIGLIDLRKKNYKIDQSAYAALVKHNFPISDDQSNGRWVRNLNDRIIRKLAIRISKEPNADISTISNEDINACML